MAEAGEDIDVALHRERELQRERDRNEQQRQEKLQAEHEQHQQLLSEDEERELVLARESLRDGIYADEQAPGKTASIFSIFKSMRGRSSKESVQNEVQPRRGIPTWVLAALGVVGVLVLWKGIDLYRQPSAGIAMLAPGVPAQSTTSSPEEARAIAEANRQAALDSSPLPNLEGAVDAATQTAIEDSTSSKGVAAVPPTPTSSPATADASLGERGVSASSAQEGVLPGSGQSDRLVELKALKDLQGRIAQLESQLEHLRATPSARPAAVAATGSAPSSAATSAPVRARPIRVSRATVAKAAAPEPVLPVAPPMSGQLLSVDMWGGKPSVVLSSGLPGDTRVRVMQPGDAYNGVALKSVDPVSKTATFGYEGGRTFTLSISQGG